MDNTAVAQVFENIGKLLEVKGDVTFKIRAYHRVAREIDHLPVDIGQLADEGKLRTIPGVGDEIEKKILELLATDKLEFYELLLQEFPPGLVEMMEVPGVGPRTAENLLRQLEAMRGRKSEQVPLGEVRPIAEAIVAALSQTPGLKNLTVA